MPTRRSKRCAQRAATSSAKSGHLAGSKRPQKMKSHFFSIYNSIMGVKRQTIEGTKIINEIDSTNLVKTTYDTADNSLIAEFKNGAQYEYEKVPHEVYAEFRLSESQGKYFNT